MDGREIEDVSYLDTRHDLLFFERHKLDEVYSVGPQGKKTKLEEIQKGLKQSTWGWMGRRDIGMINVSKEGQVTVQICIDPYTDEKTFRGQQGFRMLRPHQQARLTELRDLCVQAEIEYGLPPGTLTLLTLEQTNELVKGKKNPTSHLGSLDPKYM